MDVLLVIGSWCVVSVATSLLLGAVVARADRRSPRRATRAALPEGSAHLAGALPRQRSAAGLGSFPTTDALTVAG